MPSKYKIQICEMVNCIVTFTNFPLAFYL